MNGETQNRVRHGARAIGALAGVCALSGCVDMSKYNYFSTAPVDRTSPAAAQVNAALQASGPYPKFSQIPPTPTDVRSDAAWRSAVQGVIADHRQAAASAAAYPFTLGDSEAWAAQQRAKIPPKEQSGPSQDTSKSSEDYAKKARARATPPSASQ
jgi:hypothetical protein